MLEMRALSMVGCCPVLDGPAIPACEDWYVSAGLWDTDTESIIATCTIHVIANWSCTTSKYSEVSSSDWDDATSPSRAISTVQSGRPNDPKHSAGIYLSVLSPGYHELTSQRWDSTSVALMTFSFLLTRWVFRTLWRSTG